MSVLIKGIKMPSSCDDCDFVQRSYPEDWCYLTEKNLPCNCPLIEIPPHGDLIDRDSLIVELMDRGVEGLQTDDWHEIQQAVADAPTIIEAEVEE